MKLKQLLEHIDIISPVDDVEINDICVDPSKFTENSLFLITGEGSRKIVSYTSNTLQSAISSGVRYILWDEENWPKRNDDLETHRYIHVNHYRQACAQICSNFYNNPSKNLLMIGTTGSNGKTSTNSLIERILIFSKLYRPLLMGTLNTRCGDIEIHPSYTTPYCDFAQRLLRTAVDEFKADSAIMEVSSRGLDQGRVHTIEFDIGIYTNMIHDHLVYHGTFDEYKRVKLSFFRDYVKSFAIINRDDDYAQEFIDACKPNVKVITYAIDQHPNTNIYASNIESTVHGLNFDIHIPAESFSDHVHIPHLIGKTNVYNALAAIACSYFGMNVPLDVCKKALGTAPAIPGRLEFLTTPEDPITVIIDSAHTPTGFEEILSTVRSYAQTNKLLCLFGCRGNLDQANRPKKAAVARKICDKLIITTDGSTSEDPQQIIQDILQSSSADSNDVIVEIDRKRAIQQAILSIMENGDTLVILGKRQDIHFMLEHSMITFDDRVIVQECVKKRREN